MAATETQNYTLGRGKVKLSRFKPGTRTPEGFRYIGNTPEFSLTIESENLDHFSSDEGIREKDDSVPLEVTRSGTMTTDSIKPENVALFYFGTHEVVTVVAAAANVETFEGVLLAHEYKLGISDDNPTGYFGVENVVVADTGGGGTTYVEGNDYTVDENMGLVKLLAGGDIAEGADLDITYDVRASTRDRVISGSEPVECALIYEAHNPKGPDINYYMPYVKITPNGDYALKGDEWQQIPFSLEVLKPENGSEAIYADGVPVFA